MASKFTKFGLSVSLAALLIACDSQTPEQKVEALRAAASEHVTAGAYEAAAIEFKNALQIQPDAADLRRDLGTLYLRLGDPVSALKELGRASTLGLDTPVVRAGRARAHLMQQDVSAVLALVQAPGANEPLPGGDALTPYALRARALAGDGQLGEAVALALRVLETEDHPDARLALAAVAGERGNPANMVVQAQAALTARPDDVDGLWLLALGQVGTDARADARETLTRLRAQSWRPIRADLLTVRLALEAGETDAAWTVLDQLEKTNGNHPQVQLYVATAALERGNHEKARITAETLLGRYPNVAQASFVAGAANLELGNYVLARDQLERFLRAQPGDLRGQGMLARAARAAEQMVAERDNVASDLGAGGDQPVDPTARQVAAISDDDFQAEGLQAPEDPVAADLREAVASVMEIIRRQDFAAARDAVADMKAQWQDSPTPRELEAIVAWSAGERSQAAALMADLHREEPASVARATNLSQMYRAMDAPEKALAAIERTQGSGAEDIRLYGEAARAHAMLEDHDGVLAALKAALALQPENLRVRTVIARFHLQQGAPQAVLDLMQTAPAAAADAPDLLRLQAQANLDLGRSGDAIDLLRHVTEVLPEDPGAHQQLGQVLLGAGRPGEAVPPLTTARVLSDGALQPSLQLGRALLESGGGEAAGELIADLVAAHPEDPRVQVLLGNHALSVAQDADAAEAAFRKAMEVDPSEARLLDLVQVQGRLGRLDGAIADIEAWRTEQPVSQRTEATLGELYIAKGRYAAALPIYTGLVERAPRNAAYRNNLAWLHKEQGDLAAAQQHADAALELAPSDPNVLDTAGAISLQRGDVAKALTQLRQAAAAAPGNAEIQLNYAEALLASDDSGAADVVLAKLDPDGLAPRLQPRLDALRQQSAARR